MKRIRLSSGAHCADERETFNPVAKKSTKEAWIESHDLFVSDTGDVFALVDTMYRVYFMDAITGSIYEFGQCMTSPSLKVSGLRRNKEKAGEILMAKRIAEEYAA